MNALIPEFIPKQTTYVDDVCKSVLRKVHFQEMAGWFRIQLKIFLPLKDQMWSDSIRPK